MCRGAKRSRLGLFWHDTTNVKRTCHFLRGFEAFMLLPDLLRMRRVINIDMRIALLAICVAIFVFR